MNAYKYKQVHAHTYACGMQTRTYTSFIFGVIIGTCIHVDTNIRYTTVTNTECTRKQAPTHTALSVRRDIRMRVQTPSCCKLSTTPILTRAHPKTRTQTPLPSPFPSLPSLSLLSPGEGLSHLSTSPLPFYLSIFSASPSISPRSAIECAYQSDEPDRKPHPLKEVEELKLEGSLLGVTKVKTRCPVGALRQVTGGEMSEGCACLLESEGLFGPSLPPPARALSPRALYGVGSERVSY